MVSEDSHSNSASSIMHQFIIPNSMTNQTQFPNHEFDPYPHFQTLGARSIDLVHAPRLSVESDLNHERRLMDAQRLSLSLGSVPCRQRPLLNSTIFNPGVGYLNPGLDRVITDYSFLGNAFPTPLSSFDHHQSCSTSHGNESFVVASSRYLKPAQSLLLEMVSVGGEEIDVSNQRYVEILSRAGWKGSYGLSSDLNAEFSDSALYIHLLKLLALLEELERRYDEYYHHMEDLISSFGTIAGLESGKSYTGLALQAMSKHFCTLRNAIVSRIRATKRKMDKEMPKIGLILSRLSLFDQESRPCRAPLQQIGLMQNSRQAWRPIRGLPETSVTVLRDWLFEHFLHPYPNDSEKLMLASQTGLSKNQVSNWFINARVRLWKPMIEEMYKEEFAESSTESDQLLTSREGVGDFAS